MLFLQKETTTNGQFSGKLNRLVYEFWKVYARRKLKIIVGKSEVIRAVSQRER